MRAFVVDIMSLLFFQELFCFGKVYYFVYTLVKYWERILIDKCIRFL